jgi:hypothetical protein
MEPAQGKAERLGIKSFSAENWKQVDSAWDGFAQPEKTTAEK